MFELGTVGGVLTTKCVKMCGILRSSTFVTITAEEKIAYLNLYHTAGKRAKIGSFLLIPQRKLAACILVFP